MRAKYLVAHLLKGDAGRYHRRLSNTLSEKFHTIPLHKKAPPHVTVKIPFEASITEIAGVEHVLQHFAEHNAKQPMTFNGFGRFGHRTIYMDIQNSQKATLLVRNCINELNKLPWIQTVPNEGNKLHASVARFLTPRQFRRVWRFLKDERSYFKAELDSLAILRKIPGEHSWDIYREFLLRPFDPLPASVPVKKPLQLHT